MYLAADDVCMQDWRSALILISDANTDDHLELIDSGVLKQLIDEKWKTFAKACYIQHCIRVDYCNTQCSQSANYSVSFLSYIGLSKPATVRITKTLITLFKQKQFQATSEQFGLVAVEAKSGKEFQILVVATGNARLPVVNSRTEKTKKEISK